jgi:hypothetical protein
MKVKVGDKIYDSATTPIMLVLEEQDKNLIRFMSPKDHKFCAFPKGLTEKEIKEFMKISDKED